MTGCVMETKSYPSDTEVQISPMHDLCVSTLSIWTCEIVAACSTIHCYYYYIYFFISFLQCNVGFDANEL